MADPFAPTPDEIWHAGTNGNPDIYGYDFDGQEAYQRAREAKIAACRARLSICERYIAQEGRRDIGWWQAEAEKCRADLATLERRKAA